MDKFNWCLKTKQDSIIYKLIKGKMDIDEISTFIPVDNQEFLGTPDSAAILYSGGLKYYITLKEIE